MLIGGPESYMNTKKSVSEIKFQERVESNPVLTTLSERNRFHLHSVIMEVYLAKRKSQIVNYNLHTLNALAIFSLYP
jgi:hypothetical protein